MSKVAEAMEAMKVARKVLVDPAVVSMYAEPIAKLRGVGLSIEPDERLRGKNIFVPIPKSADAAEENAIIMREALKPANEETAIGPTPLVMQNRYVEDMVGRMEKTDIPPGAIGFRCRPCEYALTRADLLASDDPQCPKCKQTKGQQNLLVTVRHRAGGWSYVGMYIDKADKATKAVAMSTTTMGALTPLHLALFRDLGIAVETDDSITSGELAMLNVPNIEKIDFYKGLYNLPPTLVAQPAPDIVVELTNRGNARLKTSL